MLNCLSNLKATIDAHLRRTTIFVLNVLPMMPSGAVNWLQREPMVERVRYSTATGAADGDLYRPRTDRPVPAALVCLGVVPFGVEHPQVARLGRSLARAGIAALMYWSPAMRDQRLKEGDIADIAAAFEWLATQPGIDSSACGMIGTCVGASFAFMAAAQPRVLDRVSFLAAFAPYA